MQQQGTIAARDRAKMLSSRDKAAASPSSMLNT
jgi:hypothetical protein